MQNFLLNSEIDFFTLEQKIIYYFQFSKHRFPTSKEFQKSIYLLKSKQILELTNYLKELKSIQSTHINYSFARSEDLLIDVTATLYYPRNSGIQRVVRHLISSLNKKNVPYRLVRFCEATNNLLELTPEEVKQFFNWQSLLKQDGGNFVENYKIKKIKFYLKKIIGPRLSRFLGQVLHLIKQKENKAKFPSHLNIIISHQAQFFLPEVAAENWRIEMIRNFASHIFSKRSLIVYDLIPVYHPEYCAVSREFILYLSILKYFDKISCISSFVLSELKGHLNGNQMIPQQPQLAVHYLGANLSSEAAASTAKSSTNAKILCVGTFEPRKNQISILRAAKLLFDQKIDFTLTFVGNEGWLNNEIMEELYAAQQIGMPIEILQNVKDEKLIEAYQNCAFTVFVPFIEGFGLPIVESVQFKKPCITTQYGSMKEIATQLGGCILVDPHDPKGLAEKMKQLILDKDFYTQKIQECQKATWNTWDDYAMQVHQFIKS